MSQTEQIKRQVSLDVGWKIAQLCGLISWTQTKLKATYRPSKQKHGHRHIGCRRIAPAVYTP